MPVRIAREPAFAPFVASSLRAAPSGLPVADHLLEVGDQQVASRPSDRRARRSQLPCVQFVSVVVGGGPLAGARAGAVQILAPEQEFDGVIAGRDIGLDAAGLLQRAGQELRRDLRGVDLSCRRSRIDLLAMTLAV